MMPQNGLNGKQQAFCEEYVANGYNAQKAYAVVYDCWNEASLRSNTCRLLRNDKVKEYIRELQKERFEALNISAERVAEKLADIAFAEKDDNYYNATAQLKALDLLQKQMGLQTQKVDANVSTEINVNLVE